jgi:hypothetical protein
MHDFHLAATPCTPAVLLSPLRGLLTMQGESYPENVLSFYAPILEQLRAVLEEQKLPLLRVEMHITYYNSASAKAFHRIFQLLNKAAEKGCAIKLLWHYDEEDDMARDLGQNLREDFQAIEVVDMPLTAA